MIIQFNGYSEYGEQEVSLNNLNIENNTIDDSELEFVNTTISLEPGEMLNIENIKDKGFKNCIFKGDHGIIRCQTQSYIFDNCVFEEDSFTQSVLYATNFGCVDDMVASSYHWYFSSYAQGNTHIYEGTDNTEGLRNFFNSCYAFENSTFIINGDFWTPVGDGSSNATVFTLNNVKNNIIHGCEGSHHEEFMNSLANVNYTLPPYRATLNSGLLINNSENLNIHHINFVGYHGVHDFPPRAGTLTNDETSMFKMTNYYPYKQTYSLYGPPYNLTLYHGKCMGILTGKPICFEKNAHNMNVHDCHIEMWQAGVAAGLKTGTTESRNWSAFDQTLESNLTVEGTYVHDCTFDHIYYQPIGGHGSYYIAYNITSYYTFQGIDFSEGCHNSYVYNSKFYQNYDGPKQQSNLEDVSSKYLQKYIKIYIRANHNELGITAAKINTIIGTTLSKDEQIESGYYLSSEDFDRFLEACDFFSSKVSNCNSTVQEQFSAEEYNNIKNIIYPKLNAESQRKVDLYRRLPGLSYNNKIDNVYYEVANRSYYDIAHANSAWRNLPQYNGRSSMSAFDELLRVGWWTQGRIDDTFELTNSVFDINVAYLGNTDNDLLKSTGFGFRSANTKFENNIINWNWGKGSATRLYDSSSSTKFNADWNGISTDANNNYYSYVTYFYKNPVKSFNLKSDGSLESNSNRKDVYLLLSNNVKVYNKLNREDMYYEIRDYDTMALFSRESWDQFSYTKLTYVKNSSDKWVTNSEKVYPTDIDTYFSYAYLNIKNCTFNLAGRPGMFIQGGDIWTGNPNKGTERVIIENSRINIIGDENNWKELDGSWRTLLNGRIMGSPSAYGFTYVEWPTDTKNQSYFYIKDYPLKVNDLSFPSTLVWNWNGTSQEVKGLGIKPNENSFKAYFPLTGNYKHMYETSGNTTTLKYIGDTIIEGQISPKPGSGLWDGTPQYPNNVYIGKWHDEYEGKIYAGETLYVPESTTYSFINFWTDNAKVEIANNSEYKIFDHCRFFKHADADYGVVNSKVYATNLGMVNDMHKVDFTWEWAGNPKSQESTYYWTGTFNGGQTSGNKSMLTVEDFISNSKNVDLTFNGNFFNDPTIIGGQRAIHIRNAAHLYVHGKSNDNRAYLYPEIQILNSHDVELSYMNIVGYHGVHEWPPMLRKNASPYVACTVPTSNTSHLNIGVGAHPSTLFNNMTGISSTPNSCAKVV